MHPFVIDRDGSMYIDVATATNACQVKNRTPKSPGINPCTELRRAAASGAMTRTRPNKRSRRPGASRPGYATREGFAIDSADHIFVTMHGRDQLHANWPALYKPEEEATLPAEELLLLKQGGDYGWPECYYDGIQRKLVLAPEYGGDGGKEVGPCAAKLAADRRISSTLGTERDGALRQAAVSHPLSQRRVHRLPRLMGSSALPPRRIQRGVSGLADDHASGRCEVFADGFAGAVKAPGQALHRPSGVAVGPDGSLYVSDDIRGTIYRIVYRGGPGDFGRKHHTLSQRIGISRRDQHE